MSKPVRDVTSHGNLIEDYYKIKDISAKKHDEPSPGSGRSEKKKSIKFDIRLGRSFNPPLLLQTAIDDRNMLRYPNSALLRANKLAKPSSIWVISAALLPRFWSGMRTIRN
jgi:hypothetical protein